MRRTRARFTLLDAVLLALILGAGAYFWYRIQVGLHYHWAWGKIPQFFFRHDADTGRWVANILMVGFFNTLRLSFWGIALATVLGTVMGICRAGNRLFLRLASGAYVESMRNLPPLVIIFIFYFFIGDQVLPGLGLDDFLSARSQTVQDAAAFFFARPAQIEAFGAALVTLAIFEGAYITEIVRAGIQSVNRGQWEAARSLGLTWQQQMRRVILPQAFQKILPPLAGQFISLIKDSSIVSVISIQELTFQGTELMTSTLLTMEIWITITTLYLVLTLPCSVVVGRIETALARKR